MSEKNWIVKAFHTGGPYQKDADKLAESCRKFDIPFLIEDVKSRGNWNSNTHYKPQSILTAMGLYPGKSIWHVDVDTWFMQYPALFDENNDWDIAAFYFASKNTWCSGTVFCADNIGVREFLLDWRKQLELKPKQHGDQVAMGKLLDAATTLNIMKIPAGYLQGLSKHVPKGEGVIAHDGARKRYVGTDIYSDPK